MQIESVKSDILCIGGGPAGLMAAIRASELGADVVLAEKGNPGAPSPSSAIRGREGRRLAGHAFFRLKDFAGRPISMSETGT